MWLVVDLRMNLKNTCVFKEIGLHAQNMLPILGSIVNMIVTTYMTTYCTRWMMNKIYSMSFKKKTLGKWLRAHCGIANHYALIACFVTNEKWVQKEKYPNNTRLP